MAFVLGPAKGRFGRGTFQTEGTAGAKVWGMCGSGASNLAAVQEGSRRVKWCEASRAPAGQGEEFGSLLRVMGNLCSARDTVGTQLRQLAAVIVPSS